MCASFEYTFAISAASHDATVDVEGKIKKNLLLFIYLFIYLFISFVIFRSGKVELSLLNSGNIRIG